MSHKRHLKLFYFSFSQSLIIIFLASKLNDSFSSFQKEQRKTSENSLKFKAKMKFFFLIPLHSFSRSCAFLRPLKSFLLAHKARIGNFPFSLMNEPQIFLGKWQKYFFVELRKGNFSAFPFFLWSLNERWQFEALVSQH